MISASYVAITKNDLTSNHIHYKTDNATKLVVIFPGGGNSCERPVLNFLRKYYLDHQTDVLCISYTNIYLQDDEDEVLMKKITSAISEAILKVKEFKDYEKTYYICESFGNIVSNAIKMDFPNMIAKSAYISPTIEGLEYISKYPGLIITGTKDEYLDEPTINELQSRPKDNLIIIEGAGHSLMVDDVYESIDIVKMVVKRIIDYLK
ncbi:MAG: alpha/beta hydrolase [Candidatus Izimaplasma sp.]|nr:alpha/beta hydrolase [Candidatus Izimaplasma bacterium]